MFSLLQNISAKNRLWALTVVLILICCALALSLIHYDGIQNQNLLITSVSIIIVTIISIILNKIILSRFVRSINEDSFLVSENCSSGDNSLKNIKSNLSSFISTTGSQLDELTESSKLMQDISAMLIDTTKNSEACKELSDKVTRDVNEGNEIMQKMVESV